MPNGQLSNKPFPYKSCFFQYTEAAPLLTSIQKTTLVLHASIAQYYAFIYFLFFLLTLEVCLKAALCLRLHSWEVRTVE